MEGSRTRITDVWAEVEIWTTADLSPYNPEREIDLSFPAWRRDEALGEVEASVEYYRRMEAAPQHALLGGARRPTEGKHLRLTIPTSGGTLFDAPDAAFDSRHGHLNAGLPDEFTQAVVAGLTNWSTGAGEVTITSAAYSAERSSFQAFRIAAQILSLVLHGTPTKQSRRDDQIRKILQATSIW